MKKMFVIKGIKIQGFRSHSSSSINFDKGINLIIGRNGVGKSSILDAILVALYSSVPTGTKKENLIRDGSGEYKIELRFSLDNEEYELTRSSNGKRTKLRGPNMLIDGDNKVTKWIEKRLGSSHIFTNAIYVRQGEIDNIIKDEDSREKVIKKITRIEDYDNAWDNMLMLIRKFEEKRDNLKDFIEKNKSSEEELRKKEQKHQEMIDELNRKLSAKVELEREVKKLKEELQKLDGLKSTIENLEREKIGIDSEIKQLEERKRAEEEKINEITKAIEKLKKEAEKARELEPNAKLYNELLNLYSETTKMIQEIEREISYVKQNEHGLITKLQKIHQDEKELNKVREDLEKIEENIKRLKSYAYEWENVGRKLDRKEKITDELKKKGLTPEKVKEIDEIILKAKEDLDKARDEIRKLDQSISKLEAERDRIMEAIEKLETAEGECPVCGRELEEHTKEQILEEFGRKLNEISKRLQKLQEERNNAEEKKKELERIVSKEREIAGLSKLVEELEAITSELAEKNIEELRKLHDEYESLNIERNQKIGKIQTLEKSVKEKEKVLKELDDTREKISAKEREKKSILEKLRNAGFSDLESLKSEVDSLRSYYDAWLQVKDAPIELENKRRELENVIETHGETESKIEEKRRELEGIVANLEKLRKSYDAETHERIKEKYEEKGKELERVKERIESIKDIVDEIKSSIDQLEKIVEQVREYKEKIRIIENTILPKLKSIREKFRSYRTLLAEAAFKEVEHYASEIFEELTDGKYSGIVLKREIERNREKIKVRVIYQGKERDISYLSGGELIALGLAFRLALSMFMIGGKMPLLILDEPTPFLDEERRKRLVDIMNGYLKQIPQVIVVSHDDELKDAADHVISVKLEGNVSKVSVQRWW